MDEMQAAAEFYGRNYDELRQWTLRPGSKVVLGDKTGPRTCRFCNRGEPEVTFRKVAHAIPEALGNKSIESAYECDPCNEAFGNGIENDLGNWSKPMRTLARIRGKGGVPTLKKSGPGNAWRISYDESLGFDIRSYEDDPIFEIDEARRQVRLSLRRDPYTPVAVLKAFVKIALTLMPEEEIDNFREAIAWICEADHSIPFADSCPIIHQFHPGSMPNDVIVARILRRKHGAECFYAMMVLSFGNETFQVILPCRLDESVVGTSAVTIAPYSEPSMASARFSPSGTGLLRLEGRDTMRDDVVRITLGYVSGGRVRLGPAGWARRLGEMLKHAVSRKSR